MRIQDDALATLDHVRLAQGAQQCALALEDAAMKDGTKAAALLNDTRLRFGTLYLLSPRLNALKLLPRLSAQRKIALAFCDAISNDKTRIQTLASDTQTQSVLRWMVTTGAPDDGLSEAFDEVLDVAAALLMHTYGDRAALPAIAGMIFARNRQGRYTHDLIWSFFASRTAEALALVAEHLRTGDPRDAALARKLIGYDAQGEHAISGAQDDYEAYTSWLSENGPFLQFTPDNLNRTSRPQYVRVDLGAKYLRKAMNPRSGKPDTPLTNRERRLLEAFSGLSEGEKTALAHCSHVYRTRDAHEWERWMRGPIAEQISTARAMQEAAYDTH